MKNFYLIGFLLLFANLCVAQDNDDYLMISPDEWSFMTQTSPFDGTSRAAFILGTSSDRKVPTPVLSINKTEDKEIDVFLAYYPADFSDKTIVLIKFDLEYNEELYQVAAKYDTRFKRYTLVFNENLSLPAFITKLKTNTDVYMRLMNPFILIDTHFTLSGAEENIKLVEIKAK